MLGSQIYHFWKVCSLLTKITIVVSTAPLMAKVLSFFNMQLKGTIAHSFSSLYLRAYEPERGERCSKWFQNAKKHIMYSLENDTLVTTSNWFQISPILNFISSVDRENIALICHSEAFRMNKITKDGNTRHGGNREFQSLKGVSAFHFCFKHDSCKHCRCLIISSTFQFYFLSSRCYFQGYYSKVEKVGLDGDSLPGSGWAGRLQSFARSIFEKNATWFYFHSLLKHELSLLWVQKLVCSYFRDPHGIQIKVGQQ